LTYAPGHRYQGFRSTAEGHARSYREEHIQARIDRLADGHGGDVRTVGDGVMEMRVHVGPGYRVYFVERDGLVIVLLCGGDKSTQTRDIEKAKRMARDLTE
jgi:putative addiction module killer protein